MITDGKWHDHGYPEPVGSQMGFGPLLQAKLEKRGMWYGTINGQHVLVHGDLEKAKEALEYQVAHYLEAAQPGLAAFRERRS